MIESMNKVSKKQKRINEMLVSLRGRTDIKFEDIEKEFNELR
jgi:hypothetical protein